MSSPKPIQTLQAVRHFDVQAEETARIHADGYLTFTSGLDTRMVADGEVHMLGTMIWLN